MNTCKNCIYWNITNIDDNHGFGECTYVGDFTFRDLQNPKLLMYLEEISGLSRLLTDEKFSCNAAKKK